MICLARGKEGAPAVDRVWQAVRTAAIDQGLVAPANDWRDRIVVFEEDLCSRTRTLSAREVRSVQIRRPDEFWHCAASIKFADGPERRVWDTNVEGVRGALVLADMLGAPVFNHVSTAYVAGTLSGRVMETTALDPPGFNNVYEQSKYLAEQAVTLYCRGGRMRYRIMRPSVVIGHSRTHRTSSAAGLYAVLERLRKFAAALSDKRPRYFADRALRMCVDQGGHLNLIPVDVAIGEMADLAACGRATEGQVFHICSATPVNSLAALMTGLAMVGIGRVEWVARPADLSPLDRMLHRGLASFQAYLDGSKVFDRTNVARYGDDRHQRGYALTEEELKAYCRYWLESHAATRVA
jgi:nucleoside-diphosphate-sugar epimerase